MDAKLVLEYSKGLALGDAVGYQINLLAERKTLHLAVFRVADGMLHAAFLGPGDDTLGLLLTADQAYRAGVEEVLHASFAEDLGELCSGIRGFFLDPDVGAGEHRLPGTIRPDGHSTVFFGD